MSAQRWFGATGVSTINTIKVYVDEASGSTLLKTLSNLNLTSTVNYNDLIQIKIPREDLPSSFRGISVEVGEPGASETYSWFPPSLSLGWMYFDLLE